MIHPTNAWNVDGVVTAGKASSILSQPRT